jgi:hypothetical protein
MGANNFGTFLAALNVGGLTNAPSVRVNSAPSLAVDAPTTALDVEATVTPGDTRVGTGSSNTISASSAPADVESVGKRILASLTDDSSIGVQDLANSLHLSIEQLQPGLHYLQSAHMIKVEDVDGISTVALTDFASAALRVFNIG